MVFVVGGYLEGFGMLFDYCILGVLVKKSFESRVVYDIIFEGMRCNLWIWYNERKFSCCWKDDGIEVKGDNFGKFIINFL